MTNPDGGAGAPPPFRSILVTGGAGFIGSHVAVRLLTLYPSYRVVVLDKLDYCASLENLAEVADSPRFKFVRGDLTSSDLLSFVLEQEGVDAVLHFAAQTHVDNSFGNSLAFTLNNTFGTHVLLECCRKWGRIKRFVNVSTDEVYGETSMGRDAGLVEASQLEPTNPYAAAKAGAEMMCKAYLQSYRLPIIISRGNNVYGPGQFPEKAVPKFVLLASRGERLPIQGDGTATRSYLYVTDVAEAFDVLLHRGVVGETYNIGSSEERTTLDVARDVLALFGRPADEVDRVRDRAYQDRRYFIGCDKLNGLGWAQRTSWEEGLAATKAWYTEEGNVERWDAAAVAGALGPEPWTGACGTPAGSIEGLRL